MFDSVLIANRGEIAVRIAQTARKLGVRSVAVYSDADVNAMHVSCADDAINVGGPLPAQSYLDIDAIINAALAMGCQAIHPGYGFLSENPEFADACVAAGIVFIGPKSDSLRAMGHKDAAKQRMLDASVPVVPGYHGENQDEAWLLDQAIKTGFPLLIKARSGGGGKGMRLVNNAQEFATSLASAKREAMSAFGDDHVLLEKYIVKPRHIEVQVFGDQHGNLIHLFERDCSLQRRHQKVIEESPAPGIDEQFRQSICQAAVTAATSIAYEGAGTIEFIVDASGALQSDDFYFMEMNTRLQVEHPVTEGITGVDLVEWQFRVASGEPLPLQQNEIKQQGYCVEARLYAEDVPAGFLPASGLLKKLIWPSQGRIDSGVQQGDEILPFYDPMLAKLIATGDSREQAFATLTHMLRNTAILGTISNRDFLIKLCRDPDVLAGDVTTILIDDQRNKWVDQLVDTRAMALAALLQTVSPLITVGSHQGVVLKNAAWQLWGRATRHSEIELDGERVSHQVTEQSGGEWLVSAAGFSHKIELGEDHDWQAGCYIKIDSQRLFVVVLADRDYFDILLADTTSRIHLPRYDKASESDQAVDQIAASMPGLVTQVFCQVGQFVEAGDALLSLEAMKMEQTVTAPQAAKVTEVNVIEGQQVEHGQTLIRFDIDKDGA
jgi:3-methylcrotonyl-CoA carboxylase alpha subunit